MAANKHANPAPKFPPALIATGFVLIAIGLIWSALVLFGQSSGTSSATPTASATTTAPAQVDPAPTPSDPNASIPNNTTPLPLQYVPTVTPTTGFPSEYTSKVNALSADYMKVYLTARGAAARTAALTPLATAQNVSTNAQVIDQNIPKVTVKGSPAIQVDVSTALNVPVVQMTWSDGTRVYLVMASAPSSKYGWKVSMLLDEGTYKQTIVPQASSAAAGSSSDAEQGS